MIIDKIWETSVGSQIYDVKVGDLNGDGNSEVVVCTEDGRIVILNDKGEIIDDVTISEEKPIWNILLYDITGDGIMEIVSGGMEGLLNIFRWNKEAMESLWYQSLDDSVSGFFFDDVNDDDLIELVAYGLDKSLRVLNPLNGELIWGQLFESGIGTVITCDCDGDGKKEVIAGGNDGTLRVFSGKDGEMKWFKQFSSNIRCVGCFPNKKVVICGGDDKEVVFLNGIDGGYLNNFPLEEFVWACKTYISNENDYRSLINTYSFDFLDESINLDEHQFRANCLCINNNREIVWELSGFNIEDLKIVLPYVFLGTTKGTLLILNVENGTILNKIDLDSTINKVEIHENKIFCGMKDNDVISLIFKI